MSSSAEIMDGRERQALMTSILWLDVLWKFIGRRHAQTCTDLYRPEWDIGQDKEQTILFPWEISFSGQTFRTKTS